MEEGDFGVRTQILHQTLRPNLPPRIRQEVLALNVLIYSRGYKSDGDIYWMGIYIYMYIYIYRYIYKYIYIAYSLGATEESVPGATEALATKNLTPRTQGRMRAAPRDALPPSAKVSSRDASISGSGEERPGLRE